MTDKLGGTILFFLGLVVGGVLFLIMFGDKMYKNGQTYGREEVRKEAINANAGYWDVDPTTGEISFEWNMLIPPSLATPYDESENAASN